MKTAQTKPPKTAETAERLARLYSSVEYGADTFLEVFEALSADFSEPERQEILHHFNAKISKTNRGN
ncbi:hypothetical protein [Fodinibius halophilus]|uniref:Uncharacterized protein n=1 Tax=Fodinibius halophilus TaxID=1736908 RepID=A0A6M1TCC1_9BACT|nr:hypothetical protein [Fodinibius halophilus]NGP90013.1 hypothetical protein [Fodinibius halophilus]